MPTWYLVKSKFQKEIESGTLKTFSEQHLFDAVSWTNVESRFFGHFQKAANDPERTIIGITPLRLSDLIGDGEYLIWYKVRFHYQAETESGKIKKVANTMLVNAENLEDARKLSEKEFEKWLIDCHIDSIIETPILDVFPYKEEKEEPEIPAYLRPIGDVIHNIIDEVAGKLGPEGGEWAKQWADGMKEKISDNNANDYLHDLGSFEKSEVLAEREKSTLKENEENN